MFTFCSESETSSTIEIHGELCRCRLIPQPFHPAVQTFGVMNGVMSEVLKKERTTTLVARTAEPTEVRRNLPLPLGAEEFFVS